MTQLRGVIVCVNFGELLSVTLPYNRHHFDEMLIITSRKDELTCALARRYDCWLYRTESFWSDGASFAKFRALEEGLDYFGRHGWIGLLDADILWPRDLNLDALYRCWWGRISPDWKHIAPKSQGLAPGRIYSADGRRLLLPGRVLQPESAWGSFPLDTTNSPDGTAPHSECLGYTQIFHASDPVLGPPPWHDVSLPNAARGDSLFQDKWPLDDKTWLPFEVLHLGQPGIWWNGKPSPSSAKESTNLKLTKE